MTQDPADGRPQPTPGRRWKLPLTFAGLLGTAGALLGSLLVVAAVYEEPLYILTVPFRRSWLIAALGGAVGGVTRGLYSFLFDNYAFHYKHTTGKSSPCIKKIYRLDDKDMEDDYDPLEGWHLYFVKPCLGATLGILFALAVDLGFISLGGQAQAQAEAKDYMRLVVVGGMAGLFAENVLHKLQGLVAKP